MSKELIGANNRTMGSRDYFYEINRNAFVGMLMYDKSRCNYYDTLRSVAAKIQSVIDEIHSDLKDNIGMIRYIPAGNRESLIRMITGLSDLYGITNSTLNSAENCISILNLSDLRTKLKSGASEREIGDAVKLLENGGKSSLSRYDRVYIVKKAAEGGVESALGSDKKKGDFYREITARQRNPRVFLGDVLLAYQYKSSPRDYKGKYGKELCSKEYLSY
ncbi:MAG: hypothetical protein Q8878_08245, partial [Bacillota bacterium]|nr:hypothetical protein [Bacillota bacterium]